MWRVREKGEEDDSKVTALNKWRNDLLLPETGETVGTGLFLLGEGEEGIIRISVLDMPCLKSPWILSGDHIEDGGVNLELISI